MPKIDLASLPGLESALGLFGSTSEEGDPGPDVIVDIMVFLYDNLPPESFV